MSALLEGVKIERRFSRSARLEADLKGTPPLVGYVMQASTQKIFETLAAAQTETKQGAYTWTGPYGSGKSSAALLLGNLVGGGRANRKVAEALVGPGLAETIAKAFPERRGAWTVIPVTGSRTDLRTAIAAEAAVQLRWSDRVRERAAHSNANLIEMLSAPKGAGILLLLDELGKFLEHAVAHSGDIHLLQDLAERSSRSEGRLVVIGILHQAFDAYASKMSRELRQEWAKVQGRFQDVAFLAGADESVALLGRAIIAAKRPSNSALAANDVAAAVSERRPTNVSELARALRETWPLNPVTALLLGSVSRQRFAQNERSVFGFLSSAEPFGFQEFLKSEAAEPSSTYDPSRLWDYLATNFGLALASGNDSSRFSLAFDAIERATAKGNALHVALTKSAAVVELFRNGTGLAVTDRILEGCVPGFPSKQVAGAIKDLVEWAILLRQPRLGGYAMFAGSDFDVEAAIEKTASKASAQQLLDIPTEVGQGFVVAKRHYFRTGVLRAFEIVLQLVSDKSEIPQIASRLRERKLRSSGLLVLLLRDGISLTVFDKCSQELALALEEAGVVAAVAGAKAAEQILSTSVELITLGQIAKEHPQLAGDRIARREISARRSACLDALQTQFVEELEDAHWWLGPETGRSLRGRSTTIATALADAAFPLTPTLKSELVQRDRPSSNAMAAVRDLAHMMVRNPTQENLGMSGFPAEMGLYLTVIRPFGLHRADGKGGFEFREPDRSTAGKTVRPLFKLMADAQDITLDALYSAWASRPYGLKLGITPIFALAGILAQRDKLAVYVDGVFETQFDTFFVDKLLQNPGGIRLQAINRSAGDTEFLQKMSKPGGPAEFPTALSVAQTLFRRFRALPEYSKRTSRLAEPFGSVRRKVLQAEDPEGLLFDELENLDLGSNKAGAVLSALNAAEQLYPQLLDELKLELAKSLGVDAEDFSGLSARSASVIGLSNDLRFDAFAARAAGFEAGTGKVEELASLLLHKPAFSWSDRDREEAFLEIVRLARRFRELEALAAVRNRKASAEAFALIVGLSPKSAPLLKSFELTRTEQREAEVLAKGLMETLSKASSSENVSLAALARVVVMLEKSFEVAQ